ncbi:MAG: hypothetical protein A2033_05805 [Bacteroidetes bacterium GWA2_31_9]|nr:MAG: hypothetical protein A2033_05805 [Bacteroidetes bacterium GWA2_31_9]
MFYLVLKSVSRIGVVFVPFYLQKNRSEALELLTTENFEKYKEQFDDNEIKTIQLCFEITQKSLAKYFSKNNKNTKEFFSELTDEYNVNFIRPYIERRNTKIIENAKLFDFKILQFDRLTNELLLNKPVKIINSEIKFNFEKDRDGTKYHISIIANNKTIELFQKSFIFISIMPCNVFIENTIYSFSDVDGKKLQPFFTKQFIEIPTKTEKKYFETFVINLVREYEINAKGFEIQVETPIEQLVLTLEKNFHSKYILSINFKYGKYKIRPDAKEKCFVELIIESENDKNKYGFKKINRNIKSEKNAINFLTTRGLYVNNEGICSLETDNEDYNYNFVSWINYNSELLKNYGFRLVQNLSTSEFYLGNISHEIRTNLVNDWFDIHSFVTFGEFKIPFKNLKNYILENKHEYILPNGNVAIIPNEWFSKYYDLFLFSSENNESLTISKSFFKIIKDISSNNDANYTKLYKNIDELKFSTSVEIPQMSDYKLRDYQKSGFYWLNSLMQYNFGGCLADDMGLGKTLQTITLLKKIVIDKTNVISKKVVKSDLKPIQLSLFDEIDEQIQFENQVVPSLIICPTSIVYNWENEFKKFAPDIKVLTYTGSQRNELFSMFQKFDVIITSYGIARQDAERLTAFNFFYIILDESQNIKNSDSKIFQAVTSLKSSYKLVLTGTPIENSIMDLWSQFQFLNPDMLGNKISFAEEYANSVKEQNDLKIKRLKKIISPFILRRTKQEVEKDLPIHTKQLIYCEMSDEQRTYYETEKSKARNAIIEADLNNDKRELRKVTFHAISKLRQIANHPAMVNSEYQNSSGKFEEVCSRIQIINNESNKILIFSSYVKHLKLIASFLDNSDIPYLTFTGEVKIKNRTEIINKFQNTNDFNILLISLKAGGVGLNLTAASYVFVLDPWWNPASEEQAISRAHRIGQKNKVISLKFISKNTIEEKIQQLQQNKSDIADMFINSNTNPIQLSSSEILSLL